MQGTIAWVASQCDLRNSRVVCFVRCRAKVTAHCWRQVTVDRSREITVRAKAVVRRFLRFSGSGRMRRCVEFSQRAEPHGYAGSIADRFEFALDAGIRKHCSRSNRDYRAAAECWRNLRRPNRSASGNRHGDFDVFTESAVEHRGSDGIHADSANRVRDDHGAIGIYACIFARFQPGRSKHVHGDRHVAE